MIVAPSFLTIFNAGEGLPEKRLQEGFEGVGGTVRINRVPMAPAEIAAWLIAR